MPGAGSNRINEFGFYTNYYTLPQRADFLDSRTLYLVWTDDMFGGKEVGFPFIRD